MKFVKTSVTSSPEIRKRLLGGELVVPVTVAVDSFTNGVCKAGTPLTSAGVKTTESPDGILLSDVYADNPNGALVKAFAVIDATVAATHSGVTYDSTLEAKFPNIVFE